MATEPIVQSNWSWETPKFSEFLEANPHLKNHSSRLVVDPEVPIAVVPNNTTTNNSTD